MVTRCTSRHNAEHYRDRGITVCDRWRKFRHFLADMGERPKGTSLDRIDNDKGYEPGNCRWATRTQQMRNKRTNVTVEYGGRRMCLTEAAEIAGADYKRVRHLYGKQGMTLEAVLAAARASDPDVLSVLKNLALGRYVLRVCEADKSVEFPDGLGFRHAGKVFVIYPTN